LKQKSQTSGIGKPIQMFPIRFVATGNLFGFPSNIGAAFFARKIILFLLLVFSKEVYIVNKYLLLTSNYIFVIGSGEP
jgi:hypothetical protein